MNFNLVHYMNILFTCSGRRNYLINYFKKELAGRGLVFASDMQMNAPALADADVRVQFPGIDDPNYISVVKQYAVEHHIHAIISLNDLELPILSSCKKEFEDIGITLIVSDKRVVDITFDKWKTKEFLKECGLNSPKTFLSLKEIEQAIEKNNIRFPVVIKPRWGSASIGIHFPESMREMELASELIRLEISRTILSNAGGENEKNQILYQEKIEGNEYGMDVLNDLRGNYVGTFVRQKLSMRAGETDKAISVIDARFEKIGRIIGTRLRHVGNLDCDVLERDGLLYVLEMNARFGGGYPFSHESGINTVGAYIHWLEGGQDISVFNHYQSGISFSKCDRLIRI
jgi:hypothetical protein